MLADWPPLRWRARARFVDNMDQLIRPATADRRRLPRENIPRKNNTQRTRGPARLATAARLPPKRRAVRRVVTPGLSAV